MEDNRLQNVPPRFSALAGEYPELTLYRVVEQEKGLYRVLGANGAQRAAVSGRFQYEAAAPEDYPAVGDYVMAEPNDGGNAVIQRVLPRMSVFMRKAAGTARTAQVVAANIDTVFLCMALNNDFNLRRLERYLSIAWDSGAAPVVVLTKRDLCADVAEKLAAVESVAMGVDTLLVSALETDGFTALTPYIGAGRTVAFVGSSGVGKSTLINRLLGEERMETNGLRGDDKGRHTTTHRELIQLEGGATVIDTPGMRELGIWDAADGLERAFADIEQLARSCRFGDCSHGSEPGCAVRAALKSGELSAERWASYQKLLAENARAADAGGFLAAKKEKFKSIAKINKSNQKR